MFNDQDSAALADVLLAGDQRIVFAESCTAGLISGSLARIPGVSEVLAGSAVVYQLATKSAWLGVKPESLQKFGAVSQTVSEEMAIGVLQKTPHATIGASVTGHLGPDAPADLDGVAWSTIAVRDGSDFRTESRKLTLLPSTAEATAAKLDGLSIRRARQFSAVEQVLQFCLTFLEIATA